MSKKYIFPLINVLLLFMGIVILVVYVIRKGTGAAMACGTEAVAFDDMMIYTGIWMILVSLFGLIYSCCHSTSRFWSCSFCLYVTAMVVLVLLAFGGTIFAFSVSLKGSGIELPGKGYKEYKLGSYSGYIQTIVKDSGIWNRSKTCMIDTKICTRFNNKYLNDTVEKFHKEHLTSVQSGCCKPSNDCGFTYSSPTKWTEENGAYKNRDCKAWDNDPKVLCFNCDSCKAGVADKMKHRLTTSGIVSLVLFVVYIILLALAFRFKNTGDDDGFNLKYCPRVHA